MKGENMRKRRTFAVFAILSTFVFLQAPTSATPVSDTSDTTVTFENDPVLSISASTPSEIRNPTKNALVTTSSLINVSTNNETGYTLTMTASDGTSLVDETISDEDNPNTLIQTITSPITITPESHSALSANHWAFNKINTSASPTSATLNSDTTAYSPIPSADLTLTTTTAQASTSNTNLTFAVKVNGSLPAGDYSDTVVLTVVANANNGKKPSKFYNLTTMQEMTSDICAQVETPTRTATESVTTLSAYKALSDKTSKVPEVTLTDERDGQEYTVRKLADGNCWMTENLRYGAYPDTSATPSDTPTPRAYHSTDAALSDNVNEEKMQELTIMHISTTTSGFTYSYTSPYILIYQANTPNEYDATYNTTRYGTLYNYCAATAGNACTTKEVAPAKTRDGDNDGVDESVTGSICPAGWEIPTLTSAYSEYSISNISTNGSISDYGNLRNLYSIEDSTTGYTRIASPPLSFIRAGSIDSSDLINRSGNGYGVYWSATPAIDYAYYLRFSSHEASANSLDRHRGRSLRCVAQ